MTSLLFCAMKQSRTFTDCLASQTLAVLNPLARVDQHIMDDSDLAGPILFFLLFGFFLLFVGAMLSPGAKSQNTLSPLTLTMANSQARSTSATSTASPSSAAAPST